MNLEHRQGLRPPGDSGHDVLTTGGCVLQGIPYISLAVYASSPPRTLPLVGARRSSQGDRQGGLAPSNSSTSQRRPAPEPPLHDRNASSLPPGAMNGRSVGSPDWRWWPRTSRATPCEGSLRFDGRVASKGGHGPGRSGPGPSRRLDRPPAVRAGPDRAASRS